MKWIKKVAVTPLEAIAKVIDSFSSGADKTTNAPSIRIVENALNTKASNDALEQATTELQAEIDTKADSRRMFLERTYNVTYNINANASVTLTAADLGISVIDGYHPLCFQKIITNNKYIYVWGFYARYDGDYMLIVNNRSNNNIQDVALEVRVVFIRDDIN